jgi:uncharacterized damage-inducible protein DinB
MTDDDKELHVGTNIPTFIKIPFLPEQNVMTDPRYPIGKFQPQQNITDEQRKMFVQQISEASSKLHAAIQGMTDEQCNTPYREGGWMVRQVVHHLADSHLNAYVRFRLALTEHEPTIKPYHEDLWAELHDAVTAPVEPSLQLLESLHTRWTLLLRSMKPSDFARTYNHPETGVTTLDRMVQLYAWHGRHHTAQITSLKERMGWK